MATETFTAFDATGTPVLIKGRILRILDDAVTESIKASIRGGISVPASAEGLTPGNNLSDVSNVATSRDNLNVLSNDEISTALSRRSILPTIQFDGENDYTESAANSLLTFSNLGGDLSFSVELVFNVKDISNGAYLAGRHNTGSVRQYSVYISGSDLILGLYTDGSNYLEVRTTNALDAYDDEWIHAVITFGGSGPGNASAHASAGSQVSMYLNGKSVTLDAATYTGTYAGMSTSSAAFRLGRLDTLYKPMSFARCRIWRRELSASEVLKLALGGGYEWRDKYAGAIGGIYTMDVSSDSTDSWTATRATLDAASTVGGEVNNLKLVSDATVTSTHSMSRAASGVQSGKYFRVRGEYYVPSTNTSVDSFALYHGGSSTPLSITSPTLDAWTVFELVGLADGNDTTLYCYLADGGNLSFSGVSGEYVAFRNLTVSQDGVVIDLVSENYDSSEGVLRDATDNDLDATNNGATLIGGQKHLTLQKISLTDLPTSSSGLSAGSVWNDSGTIKIV